MSDPSSNTSVLEVSSKIMIAAVIVFFIVIIFIFMLHLYARCIWSTSPEDPAIVAWRRQLAQQNQLSGRAHRQKGLDKSTLQSLPLTVYNPKDFKDGLECAICLSELQQFEKLRLLPDCNHGFHLECIDKWFHSHSTCPICRTLVTVSASDSIPVEVEPQQDHEDDVNSSESSRAFPTNVLFWGDETEVRTSSVEASSSGNKNEMLAIDIPVSSSSNEEARSPVVSRIKSLKRLLSRGKRVYNNTSSTSGSNSGHGDDEQV